MRQATILGLMLLNVLLNDLFLCFTKPGNNTITARCNHLIDFTRDVNMEYIWNSSFMGQVKPKDFKADKNNHTELI